MIRRVLVFVVGVAIAVTVVAQERGTGPKAGASGRAKVDLSEEASAAQLKLKVKAETLVGKGEFAAVGSARAGTPVLAIRKAQVASIAQCALEADRQVERLKKDFADERAKQAAPDAAAEIAELKQALYVVAAALAESGDPALVTGSGEPASTAERAVDNVLGRGRVCRPVEIWWTRDAGQAAACVLLAVDPTLVRQDFQTMKRDQAQAYEKFHDSEAFRALDRDIRQFESKPPK